MPHQPNSRFLVASSVKEKHSTDHLDDLPPRATLHLDRTAFRVDRAFFAEFDLDELVRLEGGADLGQDGVGQTGSPHLNYGLEGVAESPELAALFSGQGPWDGTN